ncbi:MAG: GAP family protein [Candidatus Aenigmarchaeota archaeon]|nr:GAP family protein [Candidatus Aenigmarchaeota archaeon]
MVVEASLPAIGTVVLTAVVDAINPCAIGILILLISTMVSGGRTRPYMLKIGIVYTTAVFITYLLAGLGLTFFFHNIPLFVAEYISIAVAAIITVAGLIEIKDYFWYGRGFSLAISPDMAKRIHIYTKRITLPGAFLLGIFVTAVELPCTGGPYLAITLLLSQNFNFAAFLLLVLYNIIFIAPLIVIVAAVFFGMKIQNVKKWKHKHRSYMRLAVGLLLLWLAWLLMLIANGTINFG